MAFVHGGFWSAPYPRWLMLRLVLDARRRGWGALNVSYRQLGSFGGGGGWPATFDDIISALLLLPEHSDTPGLERTVVVGHSAGGHLTLWAARELPFDVAGVISMSGVTDLESSWRDGDPSVRALIEGAPAEQRFELTSPIHRLPLGVRVACVHGADDTTVSPAQSARFVETATAAGDDATLSVIDGERHRTALSPRSGIWRRVVELVEEWAGSSRDPQDRA